VRTNLIKIGNSKGVRIPKPLIEEAGLEDELELKLNEGKLYIEPVRKKKANPKIRAIAAAWGPSYSAFAEDWDTPEEDEAWAHLQ